MSRYLGVRFEIQRDKFVTQPVKGRIRIILGLQNTVLGLSKPRPIRYFEELFIIVNEMLILKYVKTCDMN